MQLADLAGWIIPDGALRPTIAAAWARLLLTPVVVGPGSSASLAKYNCEHLDCSLAVSLSTLDASHHGLNVSGVQLLLIVMHAVTG